MRVVDLRGKPLTAASVAASAPRFLANDSSASQEVGALLNSIQKVGIDAVNQASLKFDGFIPDPIWAQPAEFSDALAGLDSQLRMAIERSIESVRLVSRAGLSRLADVEPVAGGRVSTRHVPVDSVGLYVPGGKAIYPSSVVMNVVPAQVAGVRRLVIATPGQKQFGGRPHPTVLATAKLLGIESVLVIGGPAAIGAFAYGLDDILEPVDLITGPGNILSLIHI
mgnify:CR=1 FL=1